MGRDDGRGNRAMISEAGDGGHPTPKRVASSAGVDEAPRTAALRDKVESDGGFARGGRSSFRGEDCPPATRTRKR